MLRKTFAIFSFLLLSVVPTFAAGSECPIIPLPKEYAEAGGNFVLNRKSVVIFEDGTDAQASFLQKELLRLCNIPVSVDKAQRREVRRTESVIRLELGKGYAPEGYSVKMTSTGTVLQASTPEGLKYAIMSFLQLALVNTPGNGSVSIPCWNIKDEPAYAWRGFMLDEARHFFGVAKVKQILDWMALYRMNRFHWHLTDAQGWRIEIKGYPRLAYVGGVGNFTDPDAPAEYYTQDQIREIVSYAAERNIAVIPEIDMPGHASAAVRAYPEFSGGGSKAYPDFTFNPGKDTVYSFLTSVLKEVDALFPSQLVHLGGDEVHYGNEQWNTDEDIQSLIRRENLLDLPSVETYFFKRMADSLFSINNKIAAWDEVAGSGLPAEKTVIFFWRHDKLKQLQAAFDNGYPVVLSPRVPMYFDYSQDTVQAHGVSWKRFPVNSYKKVYEFDPMKFDVKYPKNPNILGIQANLWTERVVTDNRLDYMLFPRLAALAEAAWLPKESRNLEGFEKRLVLQFPVYKKDNLYYYNVFDHRLTGEPVN